jgi:hypothetical protein
MPLERAPLAGGEPNSISRARGCPTITRASKRCRQLRDEGAKARDLEALGVLDPRSDPEVLFSL